MKFSVFKVNLNHTDCIPDSGITKNILKNYGDWLRGHKGQGQYVTSYLCIKIPPYSWYIIFVDNEC